MRGGPSSDDARSTPSRYVHQHDTEIPKEDWLLRRLRDEYTAVTISIPRENLPIPWNDISDLRESPNHYVLVVFPHAVSKKECTCKIMKLVPRTPGIVALSNP